MELTADQLHTLRHMLGINTPERKIPKPYRNYAAVNPGDIKFLELERLGAVEPYHTFNQYVYYRCTEAGKLAAMRSFRDIRYSRSRRRYIAFLDIRDSYQDLTFKEFLTHPYWKDLRDEA